MTREETLAAAEVMRRAANGEAVKGRVRGFQEWAHCVPVWDWSKYEYCIVEVPKYRPWTADEVPVGAVVRRTDDGTRAMITASSIRGGIVLGNAVYSEHQMLEDWTMLDGSPCGVRCD